MESSDKKKSLDEAIAEQETVGLQNIIVIDSDNDASEPTEGTQLGSGVVTGVLGEGGAAVIFEIYSKDIQVKRAVKLLRPNFNSRGISAFKNELLITAQLSHSNIVTIHSTGKFNGRPFIEMERVWGRTLAKILKEKGHLPLSAVTSIGYFLCKALVYAHRQKLNIDNREYSGVVHGDLKPGNVMITADANVKVMDFGIAIPFGAETSTANGEFVGSLSYLAPEQLIPGSTIDRRADIFSLGCILYEMVTGMRAFAANNPLRLAEMRRNGTEPKIDFSGKAVPAQLRKLIEQCLKFNPSERPGTMEAVAGVIEQVHSSLTSRFPLDVLERYFSNSPVNNSPLKKPNRMKKNGLIVAAFVIPPIIGLAVVFFFAKRALDVKVSNENTPVQEMTDTIQNSIPVSVVKSSNNPAIEQLVNLRQMIKSDSISTDYFTTNKIDDAEFFLLKAIYYCNKGLLSVAFDALDSASIRSSQQLDSNQLQVQILLTRAKCYTVIFNRQPNRSSLKTAVDNWSAVMRFCNYNENNPAVLDAKTAVQALVSQAQKLGLFGSGPIPVTTKE